ncbi:unnamed protein product [Urochloa humidicola]
MLRRGTAESGSTSAVPASSARSMGSAFLLDAALAKLHNADVSGGGGGHATVLAYIVAVTYDALIIAGVVTAIGAWQ